MQTLTTSEQLRGLRGILGALAPRVPTDSKHRSIFDAQKGYNLPGILVRDENAPGTGDLAVTEAYDGAGATYDFYRGVFNRNSIDDRGMRLDSSVHYGENYSNAFWNGRQMIYGDGDGQIFTHFTGAIDVIGHELTHGVTQYDAGLVYEDQPGALNESFSDVFGSLVKQRLRNQDAATADWLIGKGLLIADPQAAIRSLKAPGTAYNVPVLGKDPQPGHMSDYQDLDYDNGGVHINSGIPNRAFYLAAIAIGGNAWERAGRIWYTALTQRIRPQTSFQDAGRITYQVAGELFGAAGPEQKAVAAAWTQVGLPVP